MSTHSWEIICFILSATLLYKPVKRLLLKCLDDHSTQIFKKIKEAENLRLDSEKTTKLYKQRHKQFSQQALKIRDTTKENISQLTKSHAELLKLKMDAKKALHQEKLTTFSLEESNKVRQMILSKALTIAQEHLEQTRSKLTSVQLNDTLSVAKRFH
jgi:F0F1-type ATP synthase membrane subunit b/b'